MKITCEAGTTKFTFEVETEEDQRFIDYLHFHTRTAYVEEFISTKQDGIPYRTLSGAIFDMRKDNPKALADEAGRKCLSALRQLAGLLSSDFASDRIVGSLSANPQPHE